MTPKKRFINPVEKPSSASAARGEGPASRGGFDPRYISPPGCSQALRNCAHAPKLPTDCPKTPHRGWDGINVLHSLVGLSLGGGGVAKRERWHPALSKSRTNPPHEPRGCMEIQPHQPRACCCSWAIWLPSPSPRHWAAKLLLAGENHCRGEGSPDAAALQLAVTHVVPSSKAISWQHISAGVCGPSAALPPSARMMMEGFVSFALFICCGNSGRAGWE